MGRDTGLGPCPSCRGTSVYAIGRPPTFRRFLLLGVASSIPVQDLVCNTCGHIWPMDDAERADPWSGNAGKPEPPRPGGDPIDEDELDRRWAEWSTSQDEEQP